MIKKGYEICASFTVAPQTAKAMATVWGTCLVKMEKVLNVGVANLNRKWVPTDLNMLRQRAVSLYEETSEGSAEMSDTKPFSASKRRLHKFKNRF